MANVLVNENSLSAIADAIREKAGTEDTYKPAEMAPAILAIPTGAPEEPERKDVNFYDYDGRRLYSYTLEEAQALVELPAPPAAPEGLVSAGWNWTLAEIKSWGEKANIGHMVYAPDGKAFFKVSIKDAPRTLYISYSDGSDSIINWGDGTVENYSAQNVSASHAFSVGEYTIEMTVPNAATFSVVCGEVNNFYMPSSALTEAYFPESVNTIYMYRRPALKKMSVIVYGYYNCCQSLAGIVTRRDIGSPIPLDDACAKNPCFALGTLISSAARNIFSDNIYAAEIRGVNSAINGASGVKEAVLTGDVGNYTFYSNDSIHAICFHDCPTIGNHVLSDAYAVEHVVIGASTTSIGTNFLAGSYTSSAPMRAALFVKFEPATPPAVLDSNIFGSRPILKILVPAGSLAAYQSATNLSRFASYMEEY